jgi:hypothetical protein
MLNKYMALVCRKERERRPFAVKRWRIILFYWLGEVSIDASTCSDALKFGLGTGPTMCGHRLSKPEVVWAPIIYNAVEGLKRC